MNLIYVYVGTNTNKSRSCTQDTDIGIPSNPPPMISSPKYSAHASVLVSKMCEFLLEMRNLQGNSAFRWIRHAIQNIARTRNFSNTGMKWWQVYQSVRPHGCICETKLMDLFAMATTTSNILLQHDHGRISRWIWCLPNLDTQCNRVHWFGSRPYPEAISCFLYSMS